MAKLHVVCALSMFKSWSGQDGLVHDYPCQGWQFVWHVGPFMFTSRTLKLVFPASLLSKCLRIVCVKQYITKMDQHTGLLGWWRAIAIKEQLLPAACACGWRVREGVCSLVSSKNFWENWEGGGGERLCRVRDTCFRTLFTEQSF